MRIATLLAAACLLGALATSASAAEPAAVEVGKARLAAPAGGQAALLVPVRYPIQLLGHRFELRVTLRGARRGEVESWVARGRASGGELRAPERRRGFVFQHQLDLGPRLARLIRAGRARPRIGVYASAVLDVDRDGDLEIDLSDRELQRLGGARAGRRQCASVAQQRLRAGKRIVVRLPACGSAVRWRIVRRPPAGSARIRGESLVYSSSRRFRGTASIRLRGRLRGAGASTGAAPVEAPVQVKVVRAGGPIAVRAIGDSVTAGFGYYSSGAPMAFSSLLSCRPASTHYNDACSSNSTNTSNEGAEVDYAPDYGLANNVSWVAQWANKHGVSDYANFAISGAEPRDWAPGGQFYATTKRVEAEDPDYVLMTVGANPLLSEMLLGIDDMGCAIESDILGGYRECVEEAFDGVKLREHLGALYTELAEHTDATIYLMGYPLSVPSTALAYSATQIAMMGVLLNEQIASVASEVDPSRLRFVAPPHFGVGVDISPVFLSAYSCSSLGYKVDARSVQSTPTQDELEVAHPLSFCSGPAKGPPWVIGADTGIHPSAAGHAQMAAQIPAP